MKVLLRTRVAAATLCFSLAAAAFVCFNPFNAHITPPAPVETIAVVPPSVSQNNATGKLIPLSGEEKEKKKTAVEEQLQKLTAVFHKNAGQWEEKILYKGRSAGINLSFMKNGISYGVGRGEGKKYEQLVWNEYFENMNPAATIAEGEQVNSNINYILGTGNGNKILNGVPDFDAITYQNAYENIDIKYYLCESSPEKLETDFILKPGADVSNIRMQLEGIKGVSVNKKGILSIKNAWGKLRQYIPASYQVVNGEKEPVDVKYKVYNNTCYGFEICGNYDCSKELVIDPVILDWATFCGPTNIFPGQPGFMGHYREAVLNDLVCDTLGHTYGTGWCQTAFPTTAGAYQTGCRGQVDVLIFKLNPKATALIFGTYVGVSNGGAQNSTSGDIGYGIDFDPSFNVYVTGSTDRDSFPTTAGAFQRTFAGTNPVTFVLKLNPTGSTLLYSTFLGSNSEGESIEVLPNGEAIVGGYTAAGFPVTAGAFKTTSGGGLDGFMTRLNASGTGLIYSTYVGGSANDTVYRVTADAAGNAYAAGTTASTNFPTAAPYQAAKNGGNDAFLFKLNPAGSALVYSTYLGGSGGDMGYGVDVNKAGEAYICGGTLSNNFPTAAPFQAAPKGKGDAFVTKFNASGSALIYSTYLGGTQDDIAWDVVVDCHDYAFVDGHSRILCPGQTNSANFPLTPCGYTDQINASTSASPPGCNNFISRFSPTGALQYSGTKWSGAAWVLRTAMDIIEVNCCVQGVVSGGTTGHVVPGYDFITTPGTFEDTDPRWTKFSTPWVYRLTPKPLTTVSVTAGVCAYKPTFTATADTCWGTPVINWNFGDGTTGTGTPITHTYAASGTYTVTATVDCPYDLVTKVVTINGAPCGPAVTALGGPVCQGGCYTVTANGTSGQAPYTYSWSPGGGTGSAISVCPSATTVYTVTVADANNVTATSTATVTINPPPAAAIASPVTICLGDAASLTATGGGTYSWNTGSSSATITVAPSASSTYSVVVTNSSGCTAIASGSVTVNTVTPGVSPATVCQGMAASLTATGGGTYSWSTGATGPTMSVSPNTTTTYSVTVTNGGCSSTIPVTVTVNAIIPAPITPPATICPGASATLTTSGGGTYSWNTGETTSSIVVTPGSNSSYSVTVIGQCTATATTAVVLDPVTANVSPPTTICLGSSSSFTASGGTSYSWNNGSTTASITVMPTASTTYSVVVSNSTGCTDVATTNITVNSVSPVISAPVTMCIGDMATLTAGGGGTYAWSNGSSSPGISVSPTSTTTYSVTVTNNGCSSTLSQTVTVMPYVVASVTSSTVCAGNNVTLTASGGTSYSWSNGSNSPTIVIANPPAGTANYSVIVSSGTSCIDTGYTSITVNPLPTPTVTPPLTICQGGTAVFTAGGGSTYTWNSGATTPSITLQPTASATYSVVVRDANGCTATANTNVTVMPIPTPAATSATICAGTSAVLTATGGTTYTWNNGQTGPSMTASPGTTSTYSVVVANAAGCTSTASGTITVIPSPTAVFSNTAPCEGSNVSFTDGSLPVQGDPIQTWNWSLPGGSPSTSTNQNTWSFYPAAGTYNATLVITSKTGCKDTVTQTVIIYAKPIALFSGNDSACASLCHTFSDASQAVNGNITNWYWTFPGGSPSSSASPNPTICYNAPGTYGASLQVTTNYGCKDTFSLNPVINVYSMPEADFCVSPDKQSITNPRFNFCDLWSSNVTQWFWTFGDGDTDRVNTDPMHSYSASVTNNDFYSFNVCLNVKTSHGCWDTICKTVELLPEFTFYIPNCFTPNGDLTNEFFFGKCRGVKEYNIWVFDRWGNMIWDCHREDSNVNWDKQYQDGLSSACRWDGKVVPGGADMSGNSGQQAQEDVYVWKVQLTDIFNKGHNYIGHVSIVK